MWSTSGLLVAPKWSPDPKWSTSGNKETPEAENKDGEFFLLKTSIYALWFPSIVRDHPSTQLPCLICYKFLFGSLAQILVVFDRYDVAGFRCANSAMLQVGLLQMQTCQARFLHFLSLIVIWDRGGIKGTSSLVLAQKPQQPIPPSCICI